MNTGPTHDPHENETWRRRIDSDVAGLKVAVSSLTRTIEDRFRELSASIHDLRNAAAPKPFNWVGVGALLLSLIAAAGTYISTRMSPIERTLVNLVALSYEDTRALQQVTERSARNEKELGALEDRVYQLERSFADERR